MKKKLLLLIIPFLLVGCKKEIAEWEVDLTEADQKNIAEICKVHITLLQNEAFTYVDKKMMSLETKEDCITGYEKIIRDDVKKWWENNPTTPQGHGTTIAQLLISNKAFFERKLGRASIYGGIKK